MKVIILLISVMVSTSYAADDVLLFKNGMKFNHAIHQTEKVGICTACHEKEPGKITGFGIEWAHKNCIECHDTFKEGPIVCSGCHTGSEYKAK